MVRPPSASVSTTSAMGGGGRVVDVVDGGTVVSGGGSALIVPAVGPVVPSLVVDVVAGDGTIVLGLPPPAGCRAFGVRPAEVRTLVPPVCWLASTASTATTATTATPPVSPACRRRRARALASHTSS